MLSFFIPDDFSFIERLGNSYEISRDGALKNMLKIDRRPSRAEAIAFWIRMSRSDSRALAGNADRLKKWQHHKALIAAQLSKEDLDHSALDLNGIFLSLMFPLKPPRLQSLGHWPLSDWDFYLLPQLWLAKALHSGIKIENYVSEKIATDGLLVEIQEAQMSWEYQKLISRARTHPRERVQIVQHLKNLSLICKNDELKQIFWETISHVEQSNFKHLPPQKSIFKRV